MRLPLRRAVVEGSSMAPTLRHGDTVVVWRLARVRPGQIVVARRPDRPDLLVVKRARRLTAGGWWLIGDNAGASDDSRVFGPVPAELVVGRVLWRYPRGVCARRRNSSKRARQVE